MSIKDFDFKELMLKHGQFVALGVGLAVLLPLTFLGLGKVFGSGRASANAKVLLDRTQQANNAIQTNRPPEDASKPPVEFLLEIKNTPINPIAYDTVSPWNLPSTIEDSKRRNPEVLLAAELKSDLARVGIPSYVLGPGGTSIMVLSDRNAVKGKLTAKQKKKQEQLEKLLKQYGLGQGGAAGGIGGGMGAMGAMGMRGMSGPGGMAGMGGMDGRTGGGMGLGGGMAPGGGGGMGAKGGGAGGFGGGGLGGILGNNPNQRQPGTVQRVDYVDIDKLENQKLAEDIRPFRLVVINGSFPYRKELEEFRSKLRKHSLTELMSLIDSGDATFQFKGFEVEWQVYGPDGKIKRPWEDHTKAMVQAINGIRALAVDFEVEDPKLKEYGMLNPGLVAPLPMLAREAKYPPATIKGLDDAIGSLNKQMKPDSKRPASDLARKLKDGGKGGAFNAFDPFSPFNFEEDEQPAANKPATPANKEADKPATDDPDADLLIPDKVLVRLVDIVEPGYTYEYRIKVKMANPNYNQKTVAYPALAKPKELVASDWSPVPKIEVPIESFWYAVDGRYEPEKINLQMHRWVDYTLPPADNIAANGVAVADWCILEREPTFRGDYIGRVANVEVPVWSIEKETYEMYHLKGRSSRVPVDFAVKDAISRHSPAVLVDFFGGKGSPVKAWGKTLKEDVPLELLVQNPDGKLIVRNSIDDEENTERSTRESDWKEWHTKIKMGGAARQRGILPPGGSGPGGKGGN